MEQKIQNILNSLHDDFELPYQLLSDYRYELTTPLLKWDHRAFLRFDVTGDIIRTELSYFFGTLNVERNIGTNDLLEILSQNNGSFQATSAFVGIKIIENTPYVSLNTYHHFLSKWEDRDIADMIQLSINDIMMGIGCSKFPDSIYIFMKK